MPKSNNDDYCGVCKEYIESAFTRVYAETPFIDGKKYSAICHCCMSVPKMYEYKNDKLIVYEEMNPSRLHTLNELIEDGFNKIVATKSLKAVKAAVKKKK